VSYRNASQQDLSRIEAEVTNLLCRFEHAHDEQHDMKRRLQMAEKAARKVQEHLADSVQGRIDVLREEVRELRQQVIDLVALNVRLQEQQQKHLELIESIAFET
jgi:polysaccharide deacetylase 2 family uncharacterized protein YibQ